MLIVEAIPWSNAVCIVAIVAAYAFIAWVMFGRSDDR